LIPYQFDPVSSWAEQNPIHLKVFDPELIPVLLEFVQQANLSCEPLQETDAFTEYRLLCNEDELNRLDTHLRLHSSAKD
jgi:hypothetical protein